MKFLPQTREKYLISLFTTLAATFFFSAIFPASAQLPNVTQQVTTVDAYVYYDLDYDGMYNWWELQYGLDPTDPSDAALDLDGDNLTNLTEFIHRTNPLKRDTDGGGVWDDLEIKLNKNPLDPADDFRPITFRAQPEEPNDPRGDSDGDGIGNTDEDFYGTDKHKVDTDDDGLNDYDELFKYLTNPLEADSDFDGISDYDEVKVFLTNPNLRDTDFDGLTDAQEIQTYKTNPTIWDTDNGGMSDFDEVNNGSDPLNTDDDYQFSWLIYYGNESNDIFKSLEENKIDIYESMNLTLEAIKPSDANQITVSYNDNDFTTKKDFIKLKLLSPDKPGIYTIKLALALNSGKEITMSRFVEIKQRGKIIRKVDGTFNNLYKRFDYFDDQVLSDAKVSVYSQDKLTGDLTLYQTDIFPVSNPSYTDSNGKYVLALVPGNYLIKFSKPEFGTKEILVNTDNYSLYSRDLYLTYNYDFIVWGMIFIIVFMLVWYLLYFLQHLRFWFNLLIEKRSAHR
jgi:hypothetical protein